MAAAVTAITVSRHVSPSTWWSLGLWSLGLILIVALSTAEVWHQYGKLCIPCAQEFPRFGAELAARRATTLRMYHRATIRVMLAGFLITVVTDTFAPMVVGDAIFAIYMLGWDWVAVRHRPLRWWCPGCRDDEDGDGMPAEDPLPTEKATR
jgi:type IV secretory pathway TrbF-like protein